MPSFTSQAPSDDGLPHSVQAYLDNPTPEGGRNNALFAAATQCRDVGMPEDVVQEMLGAKALGDGLRQDEISTTIESVFAAPRREPPRGSSSRSSAPSKRKVRNYTLKRPGARTGHDEPVPAMEDAAPIPVEAPIEEGAFEKLLLAAFEEGERVCVSGAKQNEDGEWKPDSGVTLTREKWIEKVRSKGGDFARMHSGKNGHYICLNPVEGERKNNEVTAFRHVLVEFDKDSTGADIPKDLQFGRFIKSGLPITAILDSGNKSLHAWVKVDAENLEDYKERAAEVYALFSDLDEGNHNPSRLSRAPDGFRTVKGEDRRQRLIKLGVGPDTFTEWRALNEARTQGEEWTLDQLIEYDVEGDPNTVIGNRWLCRGGSVVIVSQSGVGKSSLTGQLSLGWSAGRDDMTFGIKPIKPLRQLIIQAENDIGDVAEGIQGILKGAKLSPAQLDLARGNLIFKRLTTLTGADFVEALGGLVNLHKPDIVWIDPLLNYIGDDASKQEVISRFFIEGLGEIQRRTGVIVALIHHTAKPMKAQDKAGMTASDLAYAGFGSSAITNTAREVLVLNRLEAPEGDPPTFSLTATKRRTRAGMREFDEGGEGDVTAEIVIRHARDRIAWEQCADPRKKPDDGDTVRQGSEVGVRRGRPVSLTSAQQLEIAETAMRYPDGFIPAEDVTALARRIGKHPDTIKRFLKKLAEERENPS